MSSTLEALLQSMMPGGNTDVSSQTGNVAISVNDTSTIQEQPVQVVLQGRRATMATDTFRSLIASGQTFENLLSMKFPNSTSSRINAVTVSVGSSVTNYALTSRIPTSLLEAMGSVRVSFASESGTNG